MAEILLTVALNIIILPTNKNFGGLYSCVLLYIYLLLVFCWQDYM
jgi:hypothetical protein